MACPDGMALIAAAGDSLSGSFPSAGRDTLAHAHAPEAAFCMDHYEYPNEKGGEPLTDATWKEASDLCEARGKRLCTEAEWTAACASGGDRAYPYGSEYDRRKCNTQSLTIQLSGGSALCKSPAGLFDLSGNVYEWTASNWSPRFDDKVVKGGNWNSGPENSKCAVRFGQPAQEGSRAIGFRCCANSAH
ncbi:MAG: hypothetical protein JWP91_1539 [Fibrobacteres bacterium]|nr:hypothetical protein [Fibrobacterota bacterium]